MNKIFVFLVLISMAFTYDLTYDLSAGWNLISLPCDVEEAGLDEIFPLLPPAYSYNAATMGYEAITGIPAPNQGFFMLCMTDTVITVACAGSEPDTTTPDNTFCRGLCVGNPAEDIVFAVNDSGELLFSGISIIGLDPAPKRFFAKIGTDSEVLWAKLISSISGTAIIASGDNIIIAGNINPVSPELYVIKLNSDGDEIWTTLLLEPSYVGISGCCATSDGGIAVIAGYSLTKINGDGELDYAVNIGMQGIDLFENSYGHVVVAGNFMVGLEPPALTMIEVSSTGELLDADGIDGFPYIKYMTVAPLSDGGVLAAGYSIEDSLALLTKLSPAMTPIWSRKTGFTGTALDAVEVSPGIYAIAGYTGDDGFSAILDDDGIISANSYGADFIRPGDTEFLSSVFPGDDGLTLFGKKENYGVEAHGFLIKTDDAGESCCSSPLSTESTIFTTSIYAVTPVLTTVTPMERDTPFTIVPMSDTRLNSICPR